MNSFHLFCNCSCCFWGSCCWLSATANRKLRPENVWLVISSEGPSGVLEHTVKTLFLLGMIAPRLVVIWDQFKIVVKAACMCERGISSAAWPTYHRGLSYMYDPSKRIATTYLLLNCWKSSYLGKLAIGLSRTSKLVIWWQLSSDIGTSRIHCIFPNCWKVTLIELLLWLGMQQATLNQRH